MMWEMVIGLETHIELSTKTKIFCSCTTQFGGEPNTHCCPVCTGQPGSLPNLNKKVVKYGAMAGVALGCHINLVSKMDRKHYVYPDMPKAYQISQFDIPLCEHGKVELENGSVIRVVRIHIEEDAGKLIHEGGNYLVDYNRCGVPLIEIVTAPDFRSVEDVLLYLDKLQGIMRTIGISDCRMQEGSLRCDVNISIRPKGAEAFGTRTEIKNLNSFTAIENAINYEFERQVEILESGGQVEQETLHFNSDTGETRSMRDKENANDYRYFREPDVVTVRLSQEEYDEIVASMPELPEQRLKRYVEEYNLTEADARLLVKYRKVAEFFEAAADIDAKSAAAFILTNIFKSVPTEVQREEWNIKLSAENFRELVKLTAEGKINKNIAKRVLDRMLETALSPAEIIEKEKLGGIDNKEFEAVCRKAFEENPAAVADYKAGKEKALQALIGYVMRLTRGTANPAETTEELKKLLETV